MSAPMDEGLRPFATQERAAANSAEEFEPELAPHEIADDELRAALEAMLLVVPAPTPARDFAEAVGQPLARIESALRALADELKSRRSGVELREVGDGWRFYTAGAQSWAVRAFLREQGRVKLSGAALETLAIAAYRQPVTRSQINAIRGVDSDGVLRSLVARELLAPTGTEPGSGAIVYETTDGFLEQLGIASLAELPDIEPLLPGPEAVEEILADPRLEAAQSAEPAPLVWNVDVE
ncbi:chromosome segregation and condensation protein, ScpB [Segniliparus rotundus DSM 44985]|uniref:Chromosome segregation and condensation protein, ScpB n=1 Tax=Segniliparus rotundus (strain ATCC BAA-972 / CDC 1076 / CIP 108378 / DSM 44985 / JCM 13578) TaxID=640132 RepID=D6ZFP2_SEGRD|nr:SMC-Scp complex subunit ScpB [Segniliparus rotundus]ADG97766.1 chromosome segregation and condensation protein, ScpB [Segniliparus rotundus DSM 44985]